MYYAYVDYFSYIMNVMIPSGETSAIINEEPYMVLIYSDVPFSYSISRYKILEDYSLPTEEVSIDLDNNKVYIEQFGNFVFAFKRIDDTMYIRKLQFIDVVHITLVN